MQCGLRRERTIARNSRVIQSKRERKNRNGIEIVPVILFFLSLFPHFFLPRLVVDVSSISAETELVEDLGMDSLMHFELLQEVDFAFDLGFETEDEEHFMRIGSAKVQDVVDLVVSKAVIV